MAWLPPRNPPLPALPPDCEEFSLCVSKEVADEVRRQIGLGQGVTFVVHPNDEVTVVSGVGPPTRPVSPPALEAPIDDWGEEPFPPSP